MKVLQENALDERIQEIRKKYDPFWRLYGPWLEEANKAAKAMGQKDYRERNKLPNYQKGEGLKTGLSILVCNWERGCSFEEIVTILQRQYDGMMEDKEPLRALSVNLILEDLLAETLQPLQLTNMLKE